MAGMSVEQVLAYKFSQGQITRDVYNRALDKLRPAPDAAPVPSPVQLSAGMIPQITAPPEPPGPPPESPPGTVPTDAELAHLFSQVLRK